jgi:hypothetical protein
MFEHQSLGHIMPSGTLTIIASNSLPLFDPDKNCATNRRLQADDDFYQLAFKLLHLMQSIPQQQKNSP